MKRLIPTRNVIVLGAILVLCAAGGAISIGLLQAHLRPGSAVLSRICPATLDGRVSCAAALETRWASVSIPTPRLGSNGQPYIHRTNVPVAFAGVTYFACIGVWFTLVGVRRSSGTRWAHVPRTTVTMGGMTSLGFVGIMAFTAAPWCVWCLVVHGLNAALVPLVRSVTRPTPSPEETRPTREPVDTIRVVLTAREALSAMLVATIAVAGMAGFWRQARHHHHQVQSLRPQVTLLEELQSDPAFLLREFTAQPVVMGRTPPVRSSERVAGDRPVMLVFTDFECPACRCHARDLRSRMQHEIGSDVQVLIRHYPLSSACNPESENVHPNACDAAYAAEAARLQGGEEAFMKMHDALFERDGLDLHAYAHLASEIGLDPDQLLADMSSAVVRDIVAADVQLGIDLGIAGTPTAILDGRHIPEICKTKTFYTAYAQYRSTQHAAMARPNATPDAPTESP